MTDKELSEAKLVIYILANMAAFIVGLTAIQTGVHPDSMVVATVTFAVAWTISFVIGII